MSDEQTVTPQTVPLAPLPQALAVGIDSKTDEEGQQSVAVVLRISDPGGVKTIFMSSEVAMAIGQKMYAIGHSLHAQHEPTARERLVIASADAIPKNGRPRR